MRQRTKKIYCGSCQRLVKGREQKANSNTRVLCSRCGRPLWVWDGIAWRYMKEGI